MGIPRPPPPPPPEATSFIITLEVDGVDNTTIKQDALLAGADVNLIALSIIVKSVDLTIDYFIVLYLFIIMIQNLQH